MSLLVLSPGLFSLPVDAGRRGFRSLGIPPGGPADRRSMAIGNALVGNDPDTPALEITLAGPTLLAEQDVGMCVYGAPFQLFRDGLPLEAGTTLTLHAGQALRVGGAACGSRAYVCVPGGFDFEAILGSRSALQPLAPEDRLVCATSRLPGRSLGEEWAVPNEWTVRCLPGAQSDWFGEQFFRQAYRVTPDCNRMGLRLDGPPLNRPRREMISEPVAPGAIQITNEGKPIILGVDGQTIGGYPKIAHVIRVDLDFLGQMRPGDSVCFGKVTEDDAESLSRERKRTLEVQVGKILLSTRS